MSITDIFTREEGVDGSLEHVLPEALGGTLASRAIISLETNNLFGRTLDRALVEPFQLLQNALELRSRRGKTAGYTIDTKSGPYRLGPGMKPEVRKTGFHEVVEGDKTIVRITARSQEEAKYLVDAARKKYSDTLDLSTAQFISHSEYVEDPFHLQVSIGGPCQLRAIAKCAFEAAALALGSDVILCEAFDDIRSWIYKGALQYDLISGADYCEPASFCRHDYREELWGNLPADSEFPFAHRIFLFAESGTGVWAALELFGHLRFSVNLSSQYDFCDVNWAVSLDPITRQHRPLNPAPPAPITAIDIRSSTGADVNAVREAWNCILKEVNELQWNQLISQMISRSIDACLPDSGETILPEHINELAAHLAESYVKSVMRISSSEELTLTEFFEGRPEPEEPH